MALVNIKFHKDCVEWDLGPTTNTNKDIGSRGVISRNNIREMYLLHGNLGVAIDINDRNFTPLVANIYLGIWDCIDHFVAPIEYIPQTNTELFELILSLYIKQGTL